ncbi:MAG: hypothetical protein QOG10_5995 [Kribbellaceae bacterium]|nr:hypothetical protein [Kribbellaceae bacterium]
MATKPVIYVGLDGAWRDTGALEWALQESVLRHQPLRAVHVIEDKLRHAPYWEPAVIDDAAMDLVQEVQQQMEDGNGLLDHEADIVLGKPAATLAGLATQSQMLVVGRRGIGSFKRLLIGSTSEAVANQASVPVVVVPDGWKPPDHTGPVLVALDDSGESDTAIEFAVAAATERHARLRMVHIWDLPNVYSWDSMTIDGLGVEWAKSAQHHIEAVAVQWRHKYPELEIDVDVTRGHPVEGVIAAAESAEAQLLVVGGHHRHHLTAVLLGSVSRGVLQHATCPVAVVHGSRDDG